MPIDTIVLFDIETSGLDMRRHEIIQIAASAYSLTLGRSLEMFERKILFDEKRADTKALDVNHYDPEVWRIEGRTPQDAWREFDLFLAPHKKVRMWSERTARDYYVAQGAGFNAVKFDHPWLVEKYKQRGAFLSLSYKCLDVMQLAMWYLRLKDIELEDDRQETVCKHFGIEYDAHDALADVQAMGDLIQALSGRKTHIVDPKLLDPLPTMEEEYKRLQKEDR